MNDRFFSVLINHNQRNIFILGIFSALPLGILYVSLVAWLKESGVTIEFITKLAVAKIPYSLKFTWAPLVDTFQIPLLSKLGRRKSWMILCSIFLAVIILLICRNNPSDHALKVYILAIALGTISATFDIVFDAYRINILPDNMQAIGSSNAVLGYRFGLLIAGAGLLYLADKYSWIVSFTCAGVSYIGLIVYILFLPEEVKKSTNPKCLDFNTWKDTISKPFIGFFSKEKAMIILLAILFFKLGDAFLGSVAMIFYMEMGFTKTQIAELVKLFGFCATILGGYFVGYLLYRFDKFTILILSALLQSVTNLSYIWLHYHQMEPTALAITVAVENFASAMGTTALVSYLSNLCEKQYSASQYAFLSAISGLFSHTIVMYSGSLLKIVGWDLYFILTVILGMPAVFMLLYLKNCYDKK